MAWFGLLLLVQCGALQPLRTDNDAPGAKFLIAYFRHSIKATGAANVANLDGTNFAVKKSSLWNACNVAGKTDDEKTAIAKQCHLHMQTEFEAYDGHLAGNGKEQCPWNVGQMLRAYFPSAHEPVYSLWSGSYPRVMGTGLQTVAGFRGEHPMDKEQMPKTRVQDKEVSEEKVDGEFVGKASSEPEKDPASVTLAEEVRKIGGQRTGWLKEYLHNYAPAIALKDNDAEDEKRCKISKYPIGDGSKYHLGESGGCELSVYDAPKPQLAASCIGDARTDADIKIQHETWSFAMRDIYARTDADLIKGLNAIAKSKLFPFVKKYSGACANYNYLYAEQMCKLGQHVFNERTSGIAKADYKEIIPSCHDAVARDKKGSDCDKVIDMLNDLCWPFFAKSHLVGHAGRFVDNSMALIIGAIQGRNGIAPTHYHDMLKNAVARDHRLSIGETATELRYDAKTTEAIFMSSHDATTNGLRLLMIDAGLTPHAITHWSDGSPMQFQDELAYQVMLTFTVENEMVEVRNLVQSLYQTRKGCNGLKFNDMEPLGKWPVDLFVKTMLAELRKRNADPSDFVDPSVLDFLYPDAAPHYGDFADIA